ncbi:MAG: cation:proton antiporter [Thiotrichales bacterium]|nr:cation:proton antiporter [Thiotrichales bacterium]
MTSHEENLLFHAVVLLAIAVVTVAVSRRLSFPPILGYIIVGMIVGPFGFSLIEQEENIALLAELGIVFLLFAIGLEFSISQMMAMRRLVFGMGTAQVFATALVVYLLAQLGGLDVNTSIVIAGAFALSSTAIVIKQLVEQSEIQSRHGRSILGVLIFQDIIAIPLLILIPTLAMSQAEEGALASAMTIAFLKGILVVVIMHLIGRHLLRPLFHEVACAKSQELFTLTVLTVALGAAAFTEEMGLSMTLGAFLAGMMLSETQYRHQIESDIRPFQDILLGLFFVTVGMLISIEILFANFFIVLALTGAIIAVKGVTLYWVARLFRKEPGVSARISLSLAQVGEFGLVLMTLAFTYKLLPEQEGNILLTAAVMSMAVAPFMVKFNGHIAKFLHKSSYSQNHDAISDTIAEHNRHLSDHIILCGFGRVGQTVARFLHHSNERFTALDMDIKRVNEARLAGESVYYGDASKESILKAAGLDRAKIIMITFSDYPSTIKILHSIRHLDSQIPILVRTLDDAHVNEFLAAGATEVIPDIFESSIMLASHLLLMIGQPPSKVLRETRLARRDRYRLLESFYPGIDDDPTSHQLMKGIIHSVPLHEEDFAIGKRLQEIPWSEWEVKVDAIKRSGVRGENPDFATELLLEDHLVLSGLPEAIKRAENYLRKGILET